MSTNKTVSFKALRILTYTILIKAVIESVILVGRMISAVSIIMIAEVAELINIVACVLCLTGVIALSKGFVYVFRIMVTVLMLVCLEMLFAAIWINLVLNDYRTANLMLYIVLTLMAVVKLFVGAAFLFLMNGFAGLLKEDKYQIIVEAGEKLSVAYMCVSCLSAVALVFFGATGGQFALTAMIVFDFVGVVFEVLMYRKASYSAFHIWRNHMLADATSGE